VHAKLVARACTVALGLAALPSWVESEPAPVLGRTDVEAWLPRLVRDLRALEGR
jgi:hypothetical protein